MSLSRREPFDEFDRPVAVGRKLHEDEESKSVCSERMPVDEFAVALAAATTWFLYRPRERATGTWLRSFAFRGLSRQLCAVDELRLVCRRAANQSAQVLLTRWAGAHFASATNCLPRGRDCSTRIMSLRLPEGRDTVKKSARRRRPCDRRRKRPGGARWMSEEEGPQV